MSSAVFVGAVRAGAVWLLCFVSFKRSRAPLSEGGVSEGVEVNPFVSFFSTKHFVCSGILSVLVGGERNTKPIA